MMVERESTGKAPVRTLEDCPYCHIDGGREVAQAPRTVECERCGLYRLTPRMDRENQISYLTNWSQNLDVQNRKAPVDGWSGYQWEITLINRVFRGLLEGGRVLDVGAGDGNFVYTLTKAGAKATGLEPVRELVEYGRRFGIDLRCGRFESEALPSDLFHERFDLICLRECMYYLPDLRASFNVIRTLLSPGGCLYVKCHHAKSYYYWGCKDYSIRYGMYVSGMPTPTAIARILRQEGFRIVHSGYFPSNVFWDLGYTRFGRSLFGRIVNVAVRPIINTLGYGDRLVVLAAANAN